MQNRLALAKFKTKHGWEDLTLDKIEPKVEEELRRRRLYEVDGQSDSSSSSGSDLPSYPRRTLMSSPLKAPLFSDAVNSSGGASTGHRKRNYFASFDDAASAASPSKRFCESPTTRKSFTAAAQGWKAAQHHQLAQSSPSKPRRHQHFTTSEGPEISLCRGRRLTNEFQSPTFTTPSDEDDELPIHSFNALGSSPPRTPPMQTRSLRLGKDEKDPGATIKGQKDADLLLYLAASPSPAVRNASRDKTQMEPPSTPPQKNGKLDLPSSMMTTPGGGNLFPNTPGQGFDFSEFVNITPSPAQRPWKTPAGLSITRTPASVARRRLTFDEPIV